MGHLGDCAEGGWTRRFSGLRGSVTPVATVTSRTDMPLRRRALSLRHGFRDGAEGETRR